MPLQSKNLACIVLDLAYCTTEAWLKVLCGIWWCWCWGNTLAAFRPAVLGKLEALLVHALLLLLLIPLWCIIRFFSRFHYVFWCRKEHATPLWEVNQSHRKSATTSYHPSRIDQLLWTIYLQLEKNISCVKPEPKFPSASVRPGIMPNDRREMKGMTPNAAPQAAWAPMEKRITVTIAMESELARPSQIQKLLRVFVRSREHKIYFSYQSILLLRQKQFHQRDELEG